ncbi:BrnT family toxin [Methylobacterium sp. WL12]|nr:BrnT family toxin [Methylobacterium sp. WL12]
MGSGFCIAIRFCGSAPRRDAADRSWGGGPAPQGASTRGCGFADATGIFLDPVVAWQDTRTDDGEIRMVAVGVRDGTFYTVVYVDRTTEAGAPIRWIITTWPSHRKECAL